MAGKGFFAALTFFDEIGRLKKHVQAVALEEVKKALEEKYNKYYIVIFGEAPYKKLDEHKGSDGARAKKLGLAMRELRLEIEERIKDLNTAVSPKRSVVSNIGKQALTKGGSAVVQNAALQIVKGTFTGGVSLAVEAVKMILPSLINMAGHALISKKKIVDHYLDRGAHDFMLVYAMGHAMIQEAVDLQKERNDSKPIKFQKPQRTVFWNKDTDVRHEKDRLVAVLTTYEGLVTRILNGESGNAQHVGLLFGQQRSDEY